MNQPKRNHLPGPDYGPESWIDAHCHLADRRLFSDLDQVLERSRQAGVAGWVQGGISPEDWERQREIQKRALPGRVYLAYGLHPWWVSERSEDEIRHALKELREKLSEAQAIGELGLDHGPRFGRQGKEKEAQIHALQQLAFEEQLKMTQDAPKPLVLHTVRAHGRTLETLRKWAPYPRGGIVHLFNGSYEVAREYISLGFMISVGGSVTRRGFDRLKETLPRLPLDRIVVETDSPDQMPSLDELKDSSHNEPAYLVQIAEAVALWLNRSPKEVLDQSTRNLQEIFNE